MDDLPLGSISSGSPFSASPLKRRILADPEGLRISKSAVLLSSSLQEVLNAQVLLPSPRSRARQTVARRSGIRLMPLESFAWGGAITPHQRMTLRTRGDHVLIWVTSGSLLLKFPAQNHSAQRDTIAFIPAGTAFAVQPSRLETGHVLLIADELVQMVPQNFPAGTLLGDIGDGQRGLMHSLRNMAEEDGCEWRDSEEVIVAQLARVAMQLKQLAPPKDHKCRDGQALPDNNLVARFTELALSDLASTRTTADMAHELESTATELDRAVLATRGKRAIELLHDLRHDEAVRLLRETRSTSTEIARCLGYASHAHFSRSFVERTGLLPDVFRRKSLGNMS